MGQLDGIREHQVAAEGGEKLRAGPDPLLQLRGGLRTPGLRRQGRHEDPENRGEPAPPRLTRTQLREGVGDAQPGLRPRPHLLSPEARGRARRGEMGARELGRGARRHRRPHQRGDTGGAAKRRHLPRGTPRRGRLHVQDARRLGRGRPQQPHQRVQFLRPHRPVPLERVGQAVSRFHERRRHPAHQQPPRHGPLLQPLGPAHHRGADERGQAHRHRPQALQHGGEGRLLAARLQRHRERDSARHRALPARYRTVRRSVRRGVDELDRIHADRPPRRGGELRELRRETETRIRGVHLRVRGGGDGRIR